MATLASLQGKEKHMGEPGERLDLSTLIAYLLPGLLVQVVIFALVDSYNVVVRGNSAIPGILSTGTAGLAGLGVVIVVVGYFFGLIIDLYAHTFTGGYEDRFKSEAYSEVIGPFRELLGETLQNILVDNTSQAVGKRNVFIDTMFYHYATSQHWERQNWSWSFYEAARNLVILFLPITLILPLYASVLAVTNIGLSGRDAAGVSVIVALAIAIVSFVGPYRWLKSYRETICKVYHRHRAYIVLGVLLDRALFPGNGLENKGESTATLQSIDSSAQECVDRNE